MATVTNLGYPRIGPQRELKRALESFWNEKSSEEDLLEAGRALRAGRWAVQHARGIAHIPSNDFSLYDHVLDTSVMVGAIPRRFGWRGGLLDLSTYFAMARGRSSESASALDVPALEMTKWFDTNYHYLVPEFEPGQVFELVSTKPIDEFVEAQELALHTRPVLVGPVTYLLLGKMTEGPGRPLDLLDGLVPVYAEVLRRLAAAGAGWVQLDEPCLATDLDDATRAALGSAYAHLADAAPALRLLVAAYFGGLRDNLATAVRLPVAGLHVDLVRAPDELDALVTHAPSSLTLSLGLIDGRNVWRTDLRASLDLALRAARAVGPDRLMIAPSCSLLHVPIDADWETDLDDELRSWLAFANQKLDELVLLGGGVTDGPEAIREALAEKDAIATAQRTSRRIQDPAVRARATAVTPDLTRRSGAFPQRRERQRERLALPVFPTTTIGSFPQTSDVRRARAAYQRGDTDLDSYETFVRDEIERTIRWQESIGLDVLVHGEFERNDMVQYFGQHLNGFAFTKHGWVQSYGSRCVKPPIIFGDVSRPEPMTVRWSAYAQSITKRPVKGMLTGPITMLQWSFARDDLARPEVCRQLALAIRDEVADLEAAGIPIIQVDEPALREGLPLRRSDRGEYLEWAVECFRLATSSVADETQIHTHMCYSDFNDIIDAIAALDADVISIEASRSQMALLDAFTDYRYPNEIGPGVYDIHSPRCPSIEEIHDLLEAVTVRLSGEQLWVNPDCGLKTRRWEEVRPALANMVEAAKRMRKTVAQ